MTAGNGRETGIYVIVKGYKTHIDGYVSHGIGP